MISLWLVPPTVVGFGFCFDCSLFLDPKLRFIRDLIRAGSIYRISAGAVREVRGAGGIVAKDNEGTSALGRDSRIPGAV